MQIGFQAVYETFFYQLIDNHLVQKHFPISLECIYRLNTLIYQNQINQTPIIR